MIQSNCMVLRASPNVTIIYWLRISEIEGYFVAMFILHFAKLLKKTTWYSYWCLQNIPLDCFITIWCSERTLVVVIIHVTR
jgi:hypothetical protein